MMSGFPLDNGLSTADETLADRRVFVLDQQRWNEFTAALDAPAVDAPRLRALLARNPAWEARTRPPRATR